MPFSAFLKLVKKDELSGKTVVYSNATFTLFKLNEDTSEWEQVRCKVGKDYFTTWTTDENGIAYTENKLHYGTYKLVELQPPEGFNDLEHDVIFRISASHPTCEYDEDGDVWITIDVTNVQPVGMLHINKKVEEVDEESGYTYLAEDIDYSKIKFKLTAAEDIIDYSDGSHYYSKGDIIGVYYVGEDGTITITDLPMGKYFLQEIATLDGYILDKEIYVVEFLQTDTVTKIYEYTLNLENLMTTVEITKTDIGGDEIEGAELKVIDKNGKIVDSWTSTKEKHVIKGLLEGETYTLIEDYAPDGFVISQSIEFTVGDEIQEVKMIDKVVEISKVDIAGNELKGATLMITNKRTKNIIDKWVSGTEPHKVSGLIEGETYILHEEIAIKGYVKATDIEFTVSYDKETQKIEMIDKQVKAIKVDVKGNNVVGAKLKVIDKKGKVVDKWISTNRDHFINGLKEGETYTLIEDYAPHGFVISKSVRFTVTEDKEMQEIVMFDKQVKAIKVDVEGNTVEGAKLKVIDERGKVVDKWISTNREHFINGLKEGKTYTLIEEFAPDGFVISKSIRFTVTEDKRTQEIKMIDKIVEMSKKDIAGNELEGATIQVIDKRGKIVDEWVSSNEPHRIKNLIEGERYTLHEEIAIEGYVKATDIKFTVSEEKETQHIDMIDKVVLISKTDLVTGEELPGAELIVTDKDGNVVDRWISTDEPHYVTGLEEGKEYTLTEITCPYGYEQAESITFVVSMDKETQMIEMKDMPILSNIKVVKIDSDTKEVIKSQFSFGLYADENCSQLIIEVDSNIEEGTALFEDLRYGTYFIKEISEPEGYILSNEIVRLEINNEGVFINGTKLEEIEDIYNFEFENKQIPKIQTGNEMNYILLISIAVISLLAIILGVVLLKRNYQSLK